MKILYKLTSRSRPQKFLDTLNNIIRNAKHKDYKILCTLDDNDVEYPAIYNSRVEVILGRSINKIHAINRDMNSNEEWDVLVNMSDDMRFIKEGFDLDILDEFGADLDQFIHWNDGNQKANVCTMSIMGRTYYERFNYIYHPDYTSLFADEESTEVAKLLGKYKYMGDGNILFNHLHPAWGLAASDEQYLATDNAAMWQKDGSVFARRKQLNFEL